MTPSFKLKRPFLRDLFKAELDLLRVQVSEQIDSGKQKEEKKEKREKDEKDVKDEKNRVWSSLKKNIFFLKLKNTIVDYMWNSQQNHLTLRALVPFIFLMCSTRSVLLSRDLKNKNSVSASLVTTSRALDSAWPWITIIFFKKQEIRIVVNNLFHQ